MAFKIFLAFLLVLTAASPLTFAGRLLEDRIEEKLIALSESLITLQKDSGEWIGVVETDLTADVLALILSKKLDTKDDELIQETLSRIFRLQDPSTGAWASYPNGPMDLNTTGMVLKGLELMGYGEKHQLVAKSWRWFKAAGGVKALGMMNKAYLLMAGLIPVNSVPMTSTRFFGISKKSPVNVLNIGIAASGVIPVLTWKHYRKLRDQMKRPGILDPDRLRSAGEAFGKLSFFLHSKEFWAQEGLGWILKQQQRDGTWGGALQISYVSLLALHEAQAAGLGNFEQQINEGWRGIKGWRRKLKDGMTIQQFTVGPVMDTARVVMAFEHAPRRLRSRLLPPENKRAAISWLLKNQISQSGGWAFQYENDFYPDTDDTGMVIEALGTALEGDRTGEVERSMRRGVQWLKRMQNRNGSFGAWAKDTSRLFNWVAKKGWAGLPDITDPGQPDITSRVIKGLMSFKGGADAPGTIRKACTFLLKAGMKTPKGKVAIWKGDWMVNYAYGTSQVVTALLEAGCLKPSEASASVEWLLEQQHISGGWGESQTSHWKKAYVAGKPTLSQTGVVLKGLINYQRARLKAGSSGLIDALPAIQVGIRYLLEGLGDEIFPEEKDFTAVCMRDTTFSRYGLWVHYEAINVFGSYLSLLEDYEGP